MANRKKISLLKSQKAKLKKQRALATTPKAKALVDQRIQQVTVKIENAQKLLKGSPTPRALPPAKNQLKGASTPNALPPGKTRPTGRPSARRAQAAARATRAAQGSKGTEVRLDLRGQKAAKAEAASKAAKSVKDAAGQRAVQAARASKLPRRLSGAATAATAIEQGLALLPGPTGREVRKNLRKSDEARDLAFKTAKDELRKLGERTGAIDKKKPSKTKTESKGKVKVQTSNATRTIKKSRDYQAEAKAKPKPPTTAAPKPTPTKAPVKPKTKPIPKKDRMENASKDKRMAAWAKANAKMIRKSGTAKQRAILDKVENKPKKSAALKAGYPGNRNY